jgi:hypothetical protein
MTFINVHQRTLPVSARRIGQLVDEAAKRDSPLWPSDNWPPMILDRPLGVGAEGGHGMVRYACSAYQPGRLVEFTFVPGFMLRGTHTFEILDASQGDGCVLRHVLSVHPRDVACWFGFHLAVRWLHNALMEDLLDRAATVVGHPPAKSAHWSVWVRLLRAYLSRNPANTSAGDSAPAAIP